MGYRTAQLGMAAALLAASPAFAQGSATDAVPTVAPGDQISIACNALDDRGSDSDVRVVLTVSAMPQSVKPDVERVMATDEQLSKDAVRVRVPNVPLLDDQTVNLSVYVVDEKGAQSCDAGHVKIAQSYKVGDASARHDDKS